MERKELKERLDSLINKVKINSKDAHFADNLIDEILSVKGQLCVEPLLLDCGKEEKSYDGDTYRIVLTNKGVLYHEYGGYNIFVNQSHRAIYESLADIVVNQKEREGLDGENKKNLDTMMTALWWTLQAPKIALMDAGLTLNIATLIIKHINKLYEEMNNTELQKETPILDEKFKEAVLGIESLSEEAKNAD